jgi:hypothetical protein
MSGLFKCPLDLPDGVSDVEGCESTGLGQGCMNIKKCPVYAYNKKMEMKKWAA